MSIRQTIQAYVDMEKPISEETLRSFIGMLETGEATIDDFRTVGGEEVVYLIRTSQAASELSEEYVLTLMPGVQIKEG